MMASWMLPTITSDSTWQHGAHEAKLSKTHGWNFVLKKELDVHRVWLNVPVPWMVLLMVQKSGDHHLGWCRKFAKSWEKNYLSTGAGVRPPTVWVNYPKLKLTANTAPEHFFFEIHRLISWWFFQPVMLGFLGE